MSTEEKLANNFAGFDTLVTIAEQLLASGQLASAAVYAGMAAKFAMWNHGGIWASPRLERILNRVGNQYFGRVDNERSGERSYSAPKNILHVLTQAYSIGGHTRFLWRWIQQDSTRLHSVALTRQGSNEAPHDLVAAVKASGGNVHLLDSRRGDLLSWARDLRELAGSFDRIVLHIHPYDVIPIVALAH